MHYNVHVLMNEFRNGTMSLDLDLIKLKYCVFMINSCLQQGYQLKRPSLHQHSPDMPSFPQCRGPVAESNHPLTY